MQLRRADGSTEGLHCSITETKECKTTHHIISSAPRSHLLLLLLSSSFLHRHRISGSPPPSSPPLCHLRTRPSGGSRRDGKKRACLMRRSPQLHGTSASPACRHAAIHRLITMEERSAGLEKVGCTPCNQLPVADFKALKITFHLLSAAWHPETLKH